MEGSIRVPELNINVGYVRIDNSSEWRVFPTLWNPAIDFFTSSCMADSEEELRMQLSCIGFNKGNPFNIDASVNIYGPTGSIEGWVRKALDIYKIQTSTDGECCICFAPFDQDKHARSFTCYRFHYTCITCRASILRSSCPTCRWQPYKLPPK